MPSSSGSSSLKGILLDPEDEDSVSLLTARSYESTRHKRMEDLIRDSGWFVLKWTQVDYIKAKTDKTCRRYNTPCTAVCQTSVSAFISCECQQLESVQKVRGVCSSHAAETRTASSIAYCAILIGRWWSFFLYS